MHDQAERIAVAVAVDLRLDAGLADERIVRRHRPVVTQAQDLAPVDAGVLAFGHLLAVGAGGHVEHAVAAKDDPRRRAAGTRPPRFGHEQVLHLGQCRAVELAAGERRRQQAVLARLAVGEIEPAVLGEARMERDVHEAREPHRVDLRHPGHRRRVEDAVADDAQAAGTLGDEHVPVGQPQHRPWVDEAVGDLDDANLRPLAGVEDPRPGAEGLPGNAERGRRGAAAALCARRTLAAGRWLLRQKGRAGGERDQRGGPRVCAACDHLFLLARRALH
jgi:hypothetical protein